MKTFVIHIVLAYIVVAIQAVFFQGIKPDLALIVICFYAVKHKPVAGAAFGALTGLLIDTASGFVIGPNLLSKSLAAYLARSARENFFQWNMTISTLVIAVLSMIDILAVYMCLEIFTKMSFANRHWGISVAEVLYTCVFAAVMYYIFNRRKDERQLWHE